MRVAKAYMGIVAHYEKCLERHGDCHLGVDWQDSGDARRRYQVMLEVIRDKEGRRDVSLLDFGCGTAALYDYIQECGISGIQYEGLDISPAFVEVSKRKYPEVRFFSADILDPETQIGGYDYAVMNGVLTEKRDLEFDEMFAYSCRMIQAVFSACSRGVAVNFRANYVSDKEDELFHLPLDMLAGFLAEQVSRNFVIRNDYGLDEYTAYIYRQQSF